jgi:N-dimethylarginine dimethylaminohydrolase
VGQAGVEVIGKVGRASFEGGDFVALNANLAAVGLGPRTEPGALGELQAALGPDCELIAVRFEERYLHLDMVFNVIGPDLALACPAALPARFVDDVRTRGFCLIEVSTEEVFDHACNVLATAAESVISHSRIPRINQRLLAEGYRLTVLEVTELARSGGGPRCLTLPLDREQS